MFNPAIEKWLKTNWVRDSQPNYPPRIHDLQTLRSQTDLEIPPTLIDFLDTVNRWNIGGRYPDYKFTLFKQATPDYIHQQLAKLEEVRVCLLANI